LKRYYIFLIIICVFLVGVFYHLGFDVHGKSQYAFSRDNLIRLHVLGEDNSPKAQRDKIIARNAIIEEINSLFQDVDHHLEALHLLEENQDHLERKVYNSLDGQYDVSSRVGIIQFPETNYGNKVLAKGEYYAFQLILGEGKGENWWCVLFPPFCFLELAMEEQENVEFRSFFWDLLAK